MANNSIQYIIEVIDKFSENLKKFNNKIADMQKKMGSLGKSMANFGRSMTRMGMDLTIGISGAFAAIGIASLKVDGDMQQLQVRFTSMLDSAKAATQEISYLSNISQTAPFSMPNLEEADRMLISQGFHAKDLHKILGELLNVAAGSGKDFRSLAWVLDTIATHGTLTMRSMRMLIGLPVRQTLLAMAKAQGHLNVNLGKSIQKGDVTTAVFKKMIELWTTKGGIFFKQLAMQAATIKGQFQILRNNLYLTNWQLGKLIDKNLGVVGVLKKANLWLIKFRNNLKPFMESHKELTKFLVLLGVGITLLGPAFVIVGKVLIGLSAMVFLTEKLGLSFAALLDPIVAIGAGFAYMYLKFKLFRDLVKGSMLDIVRPFLVMKQVFDKIFPKERLKEMYDVLKKSSKIHKASGWFAERQEAYERSRGIYEHPMSKATGAIKALGEHPLSKATGTVKALGVGAPQSMKQQIDVFIHSGTDTKVTAKSKGTGDINLNLGTNMALSRI